MKEHEKQLLAKYPNKDNPVTCSICQHDLKYDIKIHRADMEWYCDTCYKKGKLSGWIR